MDVEKWVCLNGALLEMSSSAFVNANVLRSILGVWMFAALVRRDCISIPYHIFMFVDEYEGRTIRLPKIIREEILAMAAAVPSFFFNYADIRSHCFCYRCYGP